jgi:hypothetical protein
MKKSFFPSIWHALKKIFLCIGLVCGLHAATVVPVQASSSCDAVNAGTFNLTNPAFDLGNTAILTGWTVGDKITLTLTDAVGFNHLDGFFHGPTFASGTFGALEQVTVPSGGNTSVVHTVVSGDLTNGIALDPENNDSVTATCVAAFTPTTTTLSASPNPSQFGQSVTLTATVSGSGSTPTGTVTFKDGGNTLNSVTLVSGAATLQIASFAVGGHTITAVYGGDATFAASTAPGLTQIVNQGATTSALVASPNPSTLGQVVTFTATVAVTAPAVGTPTGTVTFKDGANTLGAATLVSGTATLQTSSFTAGAHTMTAVYSGDANFTGSTSLGVTQNVLAALTWVSGVGDDVNDCSRTAPCQTFAGAISKTAAGGEINCLDPGGFGVVTITKSVSILCAFTEGGILSAGTNGVIVNVATTDKVILEGLDIDGAGTGINGVRMIGAGKLTIRNSWIRNHTNYGVDLEGAANARVFITDSIITGHATGGFLVQGTGGAANSGILDRTTIDANGPASVKLGPGAALTVSESVLTGSAVAIDASAGGTVTSYGNSVIRPAATINTALPPR